MQYYECHLSHNSAQEYLAENLRNLQLLSHRSWRCLVNVRTYVRTCTRILRMRIIRLLRNYPFARSQSRVATLPRHIDTCYESTRVFERDHKSYRTGIYVWLIKREYRGRALYHVPVRHCFKCHRRMQL